MKIGDDLARAYDDGYAQGKADAVVHGHWESEDTMFGGIPFKCSICGYLTRETTDGSVLGKPKFNYCPNCGADMRGKSDG